MAKVPSRDPKDDPSFRARTGWVNQLLSMLGRALFTPEWAPWLRLMITFVIVGVVALAYWVYV